MVRKIINILLWPYTKIKEEIRFRRRLKELRKKDPFFYKGLIKIFGGSVLTVTMQHWQYFIKTIKV